MLSEYQQKPFRIAIIGFGTVGEGVYRTISDQGDKIKGLLGRPIAVTMIVVNQEKNREIGPDVKVTTDFNDLIEEKHLDVVIEATPDAQTAYDYVKRLLEKGTSIVTANKELIAKHGPELHQVAERNHCHLLFEAAVAGGIPLLNTIRHTLKTNNIERIEGILNGTSNFILTKMREGGTSFTEALYEAQEKGYAEVVPDKDINGWDALYKTEILSQWVYGKSPIWTTSKPIGIGSITRETIKLASALKGRMRHIASLSDTGKGIEASVQPYLVCEDHLLYGVDGVNNGIQIQGSIVGSIMLQGPGAGKFPTASAVIEDVINLLTNCHEQRKVTDLVEVEQEVRNNKSAEETNIQWYYFIVSPNVEVKNGDGVTVLEDTSVEDKTYGAIVFSSIPLTDLEKQYEGANIYPVLSKKLLENSSSLQEKHGKSIKVI
ncbi:MULTISPECIES: homoserine dehydrogenase [Bacillaceae]|uniref:Homoserine dehydrogenase n=1 Tax=Evansella alkalicola TaxID=745819 RepID=A0ABS6JUD9_9BACI|nr:MULTISPECIES: homoserine dehydrogenase [Bacillaceae]MBU9722192.1 homoserine dehydrogenase [Bacillus alkalicola]